MPRRAAGARARRQILLIGRVPDDQHSWAGRVSKGTCVSAINPVQGPRQPGTVGLPPDLTTEIVDPYGAPVAPSECGAILVSGPTVLAVYLKPAGRDRPDGR